MVSEINKKLVSIIILQWNNHIITGQLLESIKRCKINQSIELIVVDNASDEDSYNYLNKIYSNLRYIKNNENIGYAAGNNVGILESKGDYLFIVNNDTEFTDDLIEEILKVFDHFPDAGLVSPKFQFYFNKGYIEYAGYEKVNSFTGRNKMIGRNSYDDGSFKGIMKTSYPHGGAMMIKKTTLKEVGLMPEDYFLYYEELDWAEIFLRKGYSTYVQLNGLIYHKESMSINKQNPVKTYYITRNRILFMRRNFRGLLLLNFFIFFILFSIPKSTLTFIFKREWEHLKYFWKGILWHLPSTKNRQAKL